MTECKVQYYVKKVSEKKCNQCNGSGTASYNSSRHGSASWVKRPCHYCRGSGKLRTETEVPLIEAIWETWI